MPYGKTVVCPPVPPPVPTFFLPDPAAFIPNLAWSGIAFSPTLGGTLGRLCAVGQSGAGTRAMTSDNGGGGWTLRTTTDTVFEKVAWSPALGLFAACSRTLLANRISTSPDGITWTPQATPLVDYYDIAWSPSLGLFAAVGGVNGAAAGLHLITSPDGVTWTARNVPANNFYACVGVGQIGGVEGFIAMAGNLAGALTRIIQSTDGITWTQGVNPITLNFSGVDYSPTLGLWAACGGLLPGTQIITSPDGVVWTPQVTPIPPASVGPSRLKWSPTLSQFFVTWQGTAITGEKFMTSIDGITWKFVTSPAEALWRDIVDAGAPLNKLVILSGLVPHIAIST